jgi:hypothetical protein
MFSSAIVMLITVPSLGTPHVPTVQFPNRRYYQLENYRWGHFCERFSYSTCFAADQR